MGVILRKYSSHCAFGVMCCDSLQREATRCQNMPKREESFHRVYSRKHVLAQAMLSLCNHPAFSGFNFAKLQVGVKSDKLPKSAISGNFGPFSSPPEGRLSLSTLCAIGDFGPIFAPKTGNSNARVMIPPQSLRLHIALVHLR